MEEIWKDIKGYDGLYKISNLGRVISMPRPAKMGQGIRITKKKFLKSNIPSNKYPTIHLSNPYKQFLLHRLIAEYFIPNPENKPEINHKNGIKNDYSIDNLEWCTRSENCIHAHKSGLVKNVARLGRRKVSENDVIQIRKLKGAVKIKILSEMFGINKTQIHNICSGRSWKSLNANKITPPKEVQVK